MRRSLWIAVAATLVGAPVLGALIARPVPARVVARSERIHVDTSNGRWYHEYSMFVRTTDTAVSPGAIADSIPLTVGANDFDAMRVGKRLRIKRFPLWSGIVWISDSASTWQTFRRFVQARRRTYSNPVPMSPSLVQMAGLARVLEVHSIQRKTAPSDRSRWIHLVEVEFWAVRARALVRTIDVIDAGSMPGLHPGDIVQMHYDQREPRVLRLDDGMRTFGAH